MRPKFSAVLFAAAFALTAGPAAAEYQGKIDRTFSARPGGSITVTTERGDIDLSPWAKDQVSVVMTIAVTGVGDEDAKKLIQRFGVDMHAQDGDVTVAVTYDRPDRSLRHQPKVHMKILVPESYNADLTTAGGDISVRSLGGRAELRTSGGDVIVKGTKASVRAITSGGDLTITGAGGLVDARTSGGDVVVRDAAEGVRATTSGGDIEVEGAGGSVEGRTSGGDVTVRAAKDSVIATTSGGNVIIQYDVPELPVTEARTSGGDVTIMMVAGASARVDASTSNGAVECELPVTVLGKLARGHLAGTIGGGGNALTLRSAGGSIRLLRR